VRHLYGDPDLLGRLDAAGRHQPGRHRGAAIAVMLETIPTLWNVKADAATSIDVDGAERPPSTGAPRHFPIANIHLVSINKVARRTR